MKCVVVQLNESINCIEKFDQSIDVDLCDEEDEGEEEAETEGRFQRQERVIRLGLFIFTLKLL